MNTEFWNERYANPEFAYGTNPNEFLKEQLSQITDKGTILFPAEGEGRNAVFAAKLGWKTFAFDTSEEGRKKALLLAEKSNVELVYEIAGYENYLPNAQFDVICLIYAHVPPNKRKEYYQKCIQWLRPDGLLILEGFSKNQLGKSSGGPKEDSFLYSIDEIRNEFVGLNFTILEEQNIELAEGEFHKGNASVIRMVGSKLK
jgi:SAM-dependent methyltransferase